MIPKFKFWDGEDIDEPCIVTYKIDGVRANYKNGKPLSKSGKPTLYNLPNMPDGPYEVFIDSWNETMSVVRSNLFNGAGIYKKYLYKLDNMTDIRLFVAAYNHSLMSWRIKELLAQALKLGHEGLVIRTDKIWWKVKPIETFDVLIIDMIEGKGRNKGRMGALVTLMGKVGTGFTDADRVYFWNQRMVHLTNQTIIEVASRGLTINGKFKEPRYKRIRWDKMK